MKKATGIIPSRYHSVRFPGKPLALILEKPMIQRVYEQAQKATLLDRIIIATDHKEIYDTARSFGADIQMTSASHASGTERVAEVAKTIKSPIIINIQGDEPLIRGEMIDALVQALQEESIHMATLAAKETNLSLVQNPDRVKVVTDKKGYALYFSRSPIPFQVSDYFFQHIGIYGYRKDFLLEFSRIPQSRLENSEKLEQLRALESGFKIKIIETEFSTLSVDSPEDIIKVENFIRNRAID